ncbi:MAG: elongation factor G [Clostridia bacterium]|nr:elongation factor G [Clostridia bacterium]
MAILESSKIRNVVLLGHSGSGKTSLAEAMLFLSGGSDRLGKVPDGNTVFDFDPESIRKKISTAFSQAPVAWKGNRVNVMDTPGYAGFAGEMRQALRVADSAILVVDAKSGIQVGTELAWDAATDAGLPRAFFINKLDDPDAKFDKVMDALREKFSTMICPVILPWIEGGSMKGAVDLTQMKAFTFSADGKAAECDVPAALQGDVEKYRDMLLEAVAGTDEDLMMKYLEGEEISGEEVAAALSCGILQGDVIPAYCGVATKMFGVGLLLDAIASSFPSFIARGKEKDAEGKEIAIDEKGEAAVFVYKTVADPFVGKMSFFKVMQGSVTPDTTLKNARTGDTEKLGKIYQVKGKTQIESQGLSCGDVGMAAKLPAAATGDTLSVSGKVAYQPASFPHPYYTKALKPKAKGDEDKISSAVSRLLEEDQTLRYEVSPETKQMLLSGLGGTHLEATLAKMKSRYGVDVQLEDKKIAYRETIRKSCKVEGKHKKQSGGHGQYGHVKIEFSPGEAEGLTFTETIFGGSVPKNFHPAVEKGLQECMSKGVLAGYPVVHLAANLYDGSYHDVDSSEMAFKTAAAIAFRDGLPQCAPVLLEPVGKLSVLVPDDLVGDVLGDLNKRRGRILGMGQKEGKRGWQVVEADVPEAEMADYVHDLRAMTQGRGSFEFTVERYEEVPQMQAEKIIAAAKAEQQ